MASLEKLNSDIVKKVKDIFGLLEGLEDKDVYLQKVVMACSLLALNAFDWLAYYKDDKAQYLKARESLMDNIGKGLDSMVEGAYVLEAKSEADRRESLNQGNYL